METESGVLVTTYDVRAKANATINKTIKEATIEIDFILALIE